MFVFFLIKKPAKNLHKRRPSYCREKPSDLKREHPAFQKMKFINCFIFFWAIFALWDPDCEFRYGSRDP